MSTLRGFDSDLHRLLDDHMLPCKEAKRGRDRCRAARRRNFALASRELMA
jgi:hypothetical protein